MPSMIVHISLAAVIACALIPIDKFSFRSLIIVILSVAIIDSDAFAFVIKEGLHRALFHNLILPTFLLLTVLYVLHIDSRKVIVENFDTAHVTFLCVTTYIAVIFAGIGLDFADTGVNLFWPFHDHFYTLDGRFIVSSEEGVVQTFVNSPFEILSDGSSGTPKDTDNFVYNTPVNPNSGGSSERIFPIAYKGWQVIIILTSIVTVSAKIIQANIFES